MTSSTTTEPTLCHTEEGSSSSCSNEWVKSRINPPACTPVTQLPRKSIQHADQSFTKNSCLGSVFVRKEPLKIGLYSDDDSSIGSCDSDNDDDFDGVNHFQKRFHGIDETPSNLCYDRCHLPAATSPTNSLPSLVHSSSESVSSSSSGSTSHPSCISSFSSLTRETDKNHFSLKRKRSSSRGYGRRGNRRSVSLDKSVCVIPIPSREEYTSKVRERLWSSSEELFANAARNTVEFASEGWNWRKVVEDEGMLVHKPTGELIHPIHLHNALACIKQEEKSDKTVANEK